MRIDSHQHFWRLARGDYWWITEDMTVLRRDYMPGDLRPVLDRLGIDRTVLVQAAPTVAETRFLLDLASEHDWIAGVVGWVDLESAEAERELERLAAHPKLVGIRPMLQDIADSEWVLRDAVVERLRLLPSLGKTFDALVQPRHLRVLLRLVERLPELAIVIDHFAKPDIAARAFTPWAEEMRALAGVPTMRVKLSGLVTEAAAAWTAEDLKPYVAHVLEHFGPERVMWGSDWPVVLLRASYERWFETAQALVAELAPDGADAIFGATAARFYGLSSEARRAASRSR